MRRKIAWFSRHEPTRRLAASYIHPATDSRAGDLGFVQAVECQMLISYTHREGALLMKSCLPRLLVVAGISVFSMAVGIAAQGQQAAKPTGRRAVLLAASELKWVDAPDAKGVQQAVVWGNAQKGAHGSFAKFAAGTEVPLHTHTASGRSVVISGTVLEGLEAQKPKELGPGSYFFIPGDVKHTTGCKAGMECVIYTNWSGAFDLKPATP